MALSVFGSGSAFKITWIVRTTNATPSTQQWVNLAAVGAGVSFNCLVTAQQDNAQRGFLQTQVGEANRNSTGTGTGNSITVGPNGYVDTVTTPWTTFGAPAGWAATQSDLSAAPIVTMGVTGAAGMNIDWLVNMEVYLFGGAVLLIN